MPSLSHTHTHTHTHIHKPRIVLGPSTSVPRASYFPSGLASLRRMTVSAQRSCRLTCLAEPCEANTSSITSPPGHEKGCEDQLPLPRSCSRCRHGRPRNLQGQEWEEQPHTSRAAIPAVRCSPFSAESPRLESAAKSKPPESPAYARGQYSDLYSPVQVGGHQHCPEHGCGHDHAPNRVSSLYGT